MSQKNTVVNLTVVRHQHQQRNYNLQSKYNRLLYLLKLTRKWSNNSVAALKPKKSNTSLEKMYNGERQDCYISQIITNIIIIIVKSVRMRNLRHIRHGREIYAGFWCENQQERDFHLFVGQLVVSLVGAWIRTQTARILFCLRLILCLTGHLK